jgi:hypothetical protein
MTLVPQRLGDGFLFRLTLGLKLTIVNLTIPARPLHNAQIGGLLFSGRAK